MDKFPYHFLQESPSHLKCKAWAALVSRNACCAMMDSMHRENRLTALKDVKLSALPEGYPTLPSRRHFQQLLTTLPESSLDAASCSMFTEHFSSNRDPIVKREHLPKLKNSHFFPLYKALSSRTGKFISMRLTMKNIVFCFDKIHPDMFKLYTLGERKPLAIRIYPKLPRI